MKFRAVALCAAFLLLSSAGCAELKKTTDVTKPSVTVTLSYQEGLRYSPSYAIWVEDEAGNRSTLYATKKAAGNGFDTKRPSALPIWYGIREANADAVSGATPSEDTITVQTNLPEGLSDGKLKLFIEANASYDYNEYYREGLKETDQGFNDVNGQPSVVWMAEIDPSTVRSEAAAQVVGAGDVLGENGDLHTDLSHVTTAQQLLTSISVRYDFVR